jgi:hypothetical protein
VAGRLLIRRPNSRDRRAQKKHGLNCRRSIRLALATPGWRRSHRLRKSRSGLDTAVHHLAWPPIAWLWQVSVASAKHHSRPPSIDSTQLGIARRRRHLRSTSRITNHCPHSQLSPVISSHRLASLFIASHHRSSPIIARHGRSSPRMASHRLASQFIIPHRQPSPSIVGLRRTSLPIASHWPHSQQEAFLTLTNRHQQFIFH